jgi:TPR repeat protein
MMGQGVPKNENRAFEFFQQGAEKGSGSSMFFLAACYEEGSGVVKNPVQAKEWYQKAASAGNPNARRWCMENKVQF